MTHSKSNWSVTKMSNYSGLQCSKRWKSGTGAKCISETCANHL